MRKWVLSGILASEETYLSHLEALLLVRRVRGAPGAFGSRGPGPRSAVGAWGHPPSLESLRHLWEGQNIPPVWKVDLSNS